MSDPLQRRGLIAKALDSDPMLPPDQLDVLVHMPSSSESPNNGDPMLRILGELPEVREKAGSLDREHGFDEWTDNEDARARVLERGVGNDFSRTHAFPPLSRG